MEVLARKFDKFGWDRMDGGIRKLLLKDWMDVLSDYPLDEVDAACREAVLSNPNKMPNEGHIKALILSARAAKLAMLPKPREPEARTHPEPVNLNERREIAAKILRDAGMAHSVRAAE